MTYIRFHSALWLLLTLFLSVDVVAQKEAAFINKIVQELGGQTEVRVTSGRIDILNKEYAIEVEFANKWKNAIGQSLWYSQQTGKTPGIVLVLKTKYDFKYAVQLQTTLTSFGLADTVKVWLYPNDFQNAPSLPSTTPQEPSYTSGYWLTKFSKVRHNTSCKYYQNTRGRTCEKEEGRACKQCGG